MTNLNLRQLEVFVAVVEAGSFTDAAAKLFLAQSTVSSHVQNLEQSLHTELFRRDAKRNLTLTKAGKQTYHSAKKILNECIELEQKTEIDTEHELYIGASTVPSVNMLPDFLGNFSRLSDKEGNFEQCYVRLMYGDSNDIIQSLLDGEIQMGFTGSKNNRADLEFVPIGHDRLVMITPPTDEFKKLKAEGKTGLDLLDKPLLIRETGSGTQKRISEYLECKGYKLQDLHVKGQITMSSALVELVKEGMGVSMISNLLIEKEAEDGDVLVFELDEEPVTREIYMVRRTKSHQSELSQAFWDHCLQQRKM